MEKTKNLNYEILFLRCIGIAAVVCGHFGFNELSIVFKYFPFYSWHMPFFILISGYFYKEQNNLKKYIIKQFKKLIIPYYLINFIVVISVVYLQKKGIVHYGTAITFRNLFLEPWITGHQSALNIAAWFIPALFLVQILYAFIRKIINIKNKELYIVILTLILSLFSIYIANKGYNKNIFLILVRTGFFIFFFAFGYFFNHFIEGRFKTNRILNIVVILIIQVFLIYKFKKIIFSAVFCNEFNSFIFLPIITTLTATFFLFNITKILSPILQGNKIIEFIGSNTIAILYGHQVFMFISNFIFYVIRLHFNFSFLQNFSIDYFKKSLWYSYHLTDEYIYLLAFLIFLIVTPIVIYKLLTKYTKNIKQMCFTSIICLIILIIFINCIDIRFYLKPNTVIDFSKYGNSQKVIDTGWNIPEDSYTWSQANANIKFFTKEKKDINLEIEYNNPQFSGKVELFYNGNLIHTFEDYDEIITEKILLSQEYMNNNGEQELIFKSEIDISPYELNIAQDGRKLGICIYKMILN